MITEPLCGKEWVKEHEFDVVDNKTGAKCIRCGQCCLHVPCWWSQIQYNLYKEGSKCPDLHKEDDDTYTCLMMSKSDSMRHEMKGTGCFYPDWRKLTKLT